MTGCGAVVPTRSLEIFPVTGIVGIIPHKNQTIRLFKFGKDAAKSLTLGFADCCGTNKTYFILTNKVLVNQMNTILHYLRTRTPIVISLPYPLAAIVVQNPHGNPPPS